MLKRNFYIYNYKKLTYFNNLYIIYKIKYKLLKKLL